jgi:hypothetical protein
MLTLSGQLLSGAKRCWPGLRRRGRPECGRCRRVPGHADELRAVVAEVGRPPVLRIGHQRAQVALDGFIVQLLEFVGVVEVLAHGIALGGVLVQQVHTQLIGPPVLLLVPPPSATVPLLAAWKGHLDSVVMGFSVST